VFNNIITNCKNLPNLINYFTGCKKLALHIPSFGYVQMTFREQGFNIAQ